MFYFEEHTSLLCYWLKSERTFSLKDFWFSRKSFKQKNSESLEKRKDAFRTFFKSNFSEICSTVIFRALMNPSERGKVWAKPGQWTSPRGTLVLKPHNETQIGGTRSLTKILSSGQLVFRPTSYKPSWYLTTIFHVTWQSCLPAWHN